MSARAIGGVEGMLISSQLRGAAGSLARGAASANPCAGESDGACGRADGGARGRSVRATPLPNPLPRGARGSRYSRLSGLAGFDGDRGIASGRGERHVQRRHATQLAAVLRVLVGQAAVHGAAVVPDHEVADVPVVRVAELLLHSVVAQVAAAAGGRPAPANR